MPGMIPDHKVEEVRQATDILDLISGYLSLTRKSGANYFGLCPFHPEKTPSFSVNVEKQIFHCFGCGVGGNVFTFLMRHEGISFPEAVKLLAQRAGIELELEETDGEARKEAEALYYANEFAARFFQEQLQAESGRAARAYLENRGFKPEDIEAFGLGYAPAKWDALIVRARKEAVNVDVLIQAGLVLKNEEGRTYDRFRDRVMFPIWNLSGRVVAFGGRKLNDQLDAPKYVNSPETAIYQKGRLLYGLYQNREAIRKQDQAIFVEGYTDLMSLVSAGIKNVAATLGTALTGDQARLIRRYTKNVVLMYDSDTAGSAATLRGADILIEAGLTVRVASLPAGYDPDSFAKEHGANELQKLVQTSQDLFDFKVDRILVQPAEERAEAVRSLIQSLVKYRDTIERSFVTRRVAERLGMDESIIWSELEKVLSQTRRRSRRSQMEDRLNDLATVKRTSKIELALRDLIKVLLQDWSLAPAIFNALDLNALEEQRLFPVMTYLYNRLKSDAPPGQEELLRRFPDSEVASFIVQAYSEPLEGVDLRRLASDCIRSVHLAAIQARLDALREELRQVEQSGGDSAEILERCKALEAEKTRLATAVFVE